jgi:hypothetical protein
MLSCLMVNEKGLTRPSGNEQQCECKRYRPIEHRRVTSDSSRRIQSQILEKEHTAIFLFGAPYSELRDCRYCRTRTQGVVSSKVQ